MSGLDVKEGKIDKDNATTIRLLSIIADLLTSIMAIILWESIK